MSTAPTPIFRKAHTLTGHSDSINTIEFSTNGRYLATGGEDAFLLVFNTRNWTFKKRYNAVSPVRGIAWHPGNPDVLSCGLANGLIHTIQLKNDLVFEHAVPGTVRCLKFDTTGKQLAIGFNNEVLVVRQSSISSWTDEKNLPRPQNIDGFGEDITQAVHFHTKEKLLLVQYLYGGVVAFATDDSKMPLRWRLNIEGLCGGSALSPASRLLATTVMFSGIQWYDVGNKKLASTTNQPNQHILDVILPVTFIGANTIVSGSKIGNVSIFKLGKRDAVQVLNHNDELVQAIGYYKDEPHSIHTLVTGIAEQFDDCMLTIWTARDKRKSFFTSVGQIRLQTVTSALATALGGVLIFRNGNTIKELAPPISITAGWQKLGTLFTRSLEPPVLQVITSTVTYTEVVTKTIEFTPSVASAVKTEMHMAATHSISDQGIVSETEVPVSSSEIVLIEVDTM
ncbi:WD40-repeat-containing domain protein [Mycena latifolia]|nr:WD40-repeat-containing domain protein [Mycena latifolia]